MMMMMMTMMMQRCGDIRDEINNGYLLTGTDSRFFYQKSVGEDFLVFESTQLENHFLSCDGRQLLLQKMNNRHDVYDGKCTELIFQK